MSAIDTINSLLTENEQKLKWETSSLESMGLETAVKALQLVKELLINAGYEEVVATPLVGPVEKLLVDAEYEDFALDNAISGDKSAFDKRRQSEACERIAAMTDGQAAIAIMKGEFNDTSAEPLQIATK